MEKHEIFAKNLETIRRINGQSVAEFAKAADIPKSTLQSIRLSGHTTLDTAIRISSALNLPLDSLVGDAQMPEKADLARYMLQTVGWFQALSGEEQERVLFHFQKILEAVEK